jgi:hypothetical protein
VPLNEITRFPHAVLEIKLQLLGEDQTPPWVTDLLNTGMLLEVHKFSKFIHGCAVLMKDDVREVPYWIDDATLTQSITESGAEELLVPKSNGDNKKSNGNSRGDYFKSLLPHDSSGNVKAKTDAKAKESTDGNNKPVIRAVNLELHHEEAKDYDTREYDAEYQCFLLNYCNWAENWQAAHLTTQKVTFYYNY